MEWQLWKDSVYRRQLLQGRGHNIKNEPGVAALSKLWLIMSEDSSFLIVYATQQVHEWNHSFRTAYKHKEALSSPVNSSCNESNSEEDSTSKEIDAVSERRKKLSASLNVILKRIAILLQRRRADAISRLFGIIPSIEIDQMDEIINSGELCTRIALAIKNKTNILAMDQHTWGYTPHSLTSTSHITHHNAEEIESASQGDQKARNIQSLDSTIDYYSASAQNLRSMLLKQTNTYYKDDKKEEIQEHDDIKGSKLNAGRRGSTIKPLVETRQHSALTVVVNFDKSMSLHQIRKKLNEEIMDEKMKLFNMKELERKRKEKLRRRSSSADIRLNHIKYIVAQLDGYQRDVLHHLKTEDLSQSVGSDIDKEKEIMLSEFPKEPKEPKENTALIKVLMTDGSHKTIVIRPSTTATDAIDMLLLKLGAKVDSEVSKQIRLNHARKRLFLINTTDDGTVEELMIDMDCLLWNLQRKLSKEDNVEYTPAFRLTFREPIAEELKKTSSRRKSPHLDLIPNDTSSTSVNKRSSLPSALTPSMIPNSLKERKKKRSLLKRNKKKDEAMASTVSVNLAAPKIPILAIPRSTHRRTYSFSSGLDGVAESISEGKHAKEKDRHKKKNRSMQITLPHPSPPSSPRKHEKEKEPKEKGSKDKERPLISFPSLHHTTPPNILISSPVPVSHSVTAISNQLPKPKHRYCFATASSLGPQFKNLNYPNISQLNKRGWERNRDLNLVSQGILVTQRDRAFGNCFPYENIVSVTKKQNDDSFSFEIALDDGRKKVFISPVSFTIADEVILRCNQINKSTAINQDDPNLVSVFEAVKNNDVVEAKKLLDKNFNFNVIDETGWTPLHYSCYCSFYDLIWLLVTSNHVNVSLPSSDGTISLFYLFRRKCENEREEAKLTVLWNQFYARNPNIVNLANGDGLGMLHRAVQMENIKAVDWLLNRNADPNQFIRTTKETPLHLAIAHNCSAICRLLVNKGAKLDIKLEGGLTPLEFAAKNGSAEVVDLLKTTHPSKLVERGEGSSITNSPAANSSNFSAPFGLGSFIYNEKLRNLPLPKKQKKYNVKPSKLMEVVREDSLIPMDWVTDMPNRKTLLKWVVDKSNEGDGASIAISGTTTGASLLSAIGSVSPRASVVHSPTESSLAGNSSGVPPPLSLSVCSLIVLSKFAWPCELIPNLREDLMAAGASRQIIQLTIEQKMQIHREIDLSQIEIQDVIGKGATCVVYSCIYNNQKLAMKAYNDMYGDEYLLKEFYFEVAITSLINHPHVIHCVGACTKGERLFLLTDIYEKGNLHSYMRKRGSKLDWTQKLSLAMKVAKGLAHLHSIGIIHRDLKPQNVMIGDKGRVAITDFGTSRVFSARSFHTANTGTTQWIAPEVYGKNGAQIIYNEKADIYSFGMLLYEIVSGLEPFAEEQIFDIPDLALKGVRPQVTKDCPSALKLLIEQCWHGDPQSRPTAQEILAQLTELYLRLKRVL